MSTTMSNRVRMNTCRFAGCNHDHKTIWARHDAIKYGVRHYMHSDCYVKSGKPFADLSRWQLGNLPYFVVKAAGRLDEWHAAEKAAFQ